MVFFSTTLTASTTIQSLMANRPGIIRASQVMIKVRSMGTASYVAIGGIDSQDSRLLSVGDATSVSGTPSNPTFNPSKIYVSSDTSDAVIEVLGERI